MTDPALVWCVVYDDADRYPPDHPGRPYRAGTVVEFFTSRPQTPADGGDPGNWPAKGQVFEGHPDGGDSVCIASWDLRPTSGLLR